MEGDSDIEWASRTATGSMTTTRGVLFTKGELTIRKSAQPTSTSPRRSAAWRVIARVRLLMSPVRTSPPETMNMAAIVQGAGLEKARRTWSWGTTPSSTTAAAPPMAVTSGG